MAKIEIKKTATFAQPDPAAPQVRVVKGDIIDTADETYKNVFKRIIETEVGQVIEGVIDGIKNVAEGVKDVIDDAVDTVVDTVTDIFDGDDNDKDENGTMSPDELKSMIEADIADMKLAHAKAHIIDYGAALGIDVKKSARVSTMINNLVEAYKDI